MALAADQNVRMLGQYQTTNVEWSSSVKKRGHQDLIQPMWYKEKRRSHATTRSASSGGSKQIFKRHGCNQSTHEKYRGTEGETPWQKHV